MLTKESTKYISSLSKKLDIIDSTYLKQLFIFFKNHNFNYTDSNISIYRGKYPLPSNKYTDNKLLVKMKSNNNVYQYTWKVNKKSTCNFYYYTKNNFNDLIIDKYIYIISYIISLSKNKHNINIYLTHLDDKKVFNNKYSTININSGLTIYKDKLGSDCYIYRKEESVKVLIHELLHAIYVSNIPNDSSIVNNYNKKYKINTKTININETYTEIWAKLLNCFFSTYFSNSYDYNTFNKFVSIEKKFSQIQAYKIISSLKPNQDINKHTHVVGYYLCINELFYNIDKFLKDRFNQDNLIILHNNVNFINFMLNNQEYEIHKIKKNSIFKNTFRMTAVELKLSRR